MNNDNNKKMVKICTKLGELGEEAVLLATTYTTLAVRSFFWVPMQKEIPAKLRYFFVLGETQCKKKELSEHVRSCTHIQLF